MLSARWRVGAFVAARSVVRVAEGERNYHSFYHLVAGAPADLTGKLGLSKGAKSFHYLSQSSVTELPMMPDKGMYEGLVQALGTCGVSAE